MKNLKMSRKLLVMFVISGLFPLLILSGISTYYSQEQIESEIFKETEMYVNLTESQIDEYFGKIESSGKILATSSNVIEALLIADEYGLESAEWNEKYNETYEYLNNALQEIGFTGFFISNTSKTIIVSIPNTTDGMDVSGHLGVVSALKGENSWSEIQFYDEVDMGGINYYVPVYSENNNGEIIGALCIFLDSKKLDGIIHKDIESLGATADSYLVNEDGLLFTDTVHGEYAEDAAFKVTMELEDNTGTEGMQEKGIAFEDINKVEVHKGENYLGKEILGSSTIVHVGNQPVKLIVEISGEEVFAGLNKLTSKSLIIMIITIVFGIVVAILFARSISIPIKNTVLILDELASLKLNYSVPEDAKTRKDEMGNIGMALISLQNSLKTVVKQIANSSENVAASSEELTATTEQSLNATEQVANAIEEVARGANEQAIETEKGANKITELGEEIERSHKYAEEVLNSADIIVKKMNEGLVSVDDLTNKTEESVRANNEINQKIINTNNSSEQIKKASNVIASIADQTNLLSLNAAIEAARAGEAGKGFAVVADEIRQLAEQSSKSTSEIDIIVKELKENTDAVVQAMKKIMDISNEQEASVKITGLKFKEISEAIEVAQIGIKNLSASNIEMENSKELITDIMQSLSAIAEENAANTEEVSASTEEQSASMEEITSSSENLAKLAQYLQDMVNKFKL